MSLAEAQAWLEIVPAEAHRTRPARDTRPTRQSRASASAAQTGYGYDAALENAPPTAASARPELSPLGSKCSDTLSEVPKQQGPARTARSGAHSTLDTAVGDFARVVRTGGRVVLSDIHPFASLTLGQAFFETQDGRRLFVRNHVHLPSAYLSAFAAHGLSVRRCAEPLMTEEWLPRRAVGFSREATAEAYVGLPFALIWDLEKT